jgi:hypothetical protein
MDGGQHQLAAHQFEYFEGDRDQVVDDILEEGGELNSIVQEEEDENGSTPY